MFKHLRDDFPASVVVFFVALPLCLGIALASGAPPLSGLIAGIVGGIVVGALSGSKVGVSGPAAGLAAMVLVAIGDLGKFEIFLTAVVLAGLIQILFGVLRAGIIGYFFPNSVILGMLSGIGIVIIMKQLPHLVGYDAAPMIDDAVNTAHINDMNLIEHLFEKITEGALIIGMVSLGLILFWDNILGKYHKFFKLIQGSIIAVVIGTLLKLGFDGGALAIEGKHLVNIPVATSVSDMAKFFTFPDFSAFFNPKVITIAFTLALVASLETLLCVEATDKIDPAKNVTPTNRELLAQGAGNMLSGLIGGLPVTQVIVRSSANIQSNAKTKLSTILHGVFLLLSVLVFSSVLNHIPNAALAAILILVGYKLAKPALFITMWKRGWTQFVPFIVTIIVLVKFDLLTGIAVGMACGIFVVLYKSYNNSLFLHKENLGDKEHVRMVLAEEITFFNKATIQKELNNLPENCHLELDVRKTVYLDQDVVEILENFVVQAKNKHIHVHLLTQKGMINDPESYVNFFNLLKQSN